jgi:hypothetical protein
VLGDGVDDPHRNRDRSRRPPNGSVAGRRAATRRADRPLPLMRRHPTWDGAAATLGRFCAAGMVPRRRGLCGRRQSGPAVSRRREADRPSTSSKTVDIKRFFRNGDLLSVHHQPWGARVGDLASRGPSHRISPSVAATPIQRSDLVRRSGRSGRRRVRMWAGPEIASWTRYHQLQGVVLYVVLGGGKRRVSVVRSSVAVVVREHVSLGRHRVRARTISDRADIRGALVRRRW